MNQRQLRRQLITLREFMRWQWRIVEAEGDMDEALRVNWEIRKQNQRIRTKLTAEKRRRA